MAHKLPPSCSASHRVPPHDGSSCADWAVAISTQVACALTTSFPNAPLSAMLHSPALSPNPPDPTFHAELLRPAPSPTTPHQTSPHRSQVTDPLPDTVPQLVLTLVVSVGGVLVLSLIFGAATTVVGELQVASHPEGHRGGSVGGSLGGSLQVASHSEGHRGGSLEGSLGGSIQVAARTATTFYARPLPGTLLSPYHCSTPYGACRTHHRRSSTRPYPASRCRHSTTRRAASYSASSGIPRSAGCRARCANGSLPSTRSCIPRR